jgi:hypothetical protein
MSISYSINSVGLKSKEYCEIYKYKEVSDYKGFKFIEPKGMRK